MSLQGGQVVKDLLAFLLVARAELRFDRLMKKPAPDYTLEDTAHTNGALYVAGVDEVGRGPLCGPVTAAAVILDPANIPEGLNDSKKLTAKRREGLYDLIIASAIVSVGEASVEEIDQINILRASHLAMTRAVAGLAQQPGHVLIDGNMIPRNFPISAQAIIKGDSKSVSISAASIVAKVCRDRLMVDLAQQYPGYGWEKNCGYPTFQHLTALKEIGVTPHHRRTFKPVHNILYQGKNLSD